jgi:hypothetical protein
MTRSVELSTLGLSHAVHFMRMKTGVVCRRVRWVGGKDGREVLEYETEKSMISRRSGIK